MLPDQNERKTGKKEMTEITEREEKKREEIDRDEKLSQL